MADLFVAQFYQVFGRENTDLGIVGRDHRTREPLESTVDEYDLCSFVDHCPICLDL